MRKIGNVTAYREELKQKILYTAMSLFKEKGIKAVRMDDIATKMVISKRTLYEIYSNKEDLLYECIKNDNEILMKKIADYASMAENEMAVVAFFIRTKLKDLGSINPLFFSEMEKYERILAFFKENSEKLRKMLVVEGKSFSDPVIVDGKEDYNKSRRVELKLRVKARNFAQIFGLNFGND